MNSVVAESGTLKYADLVCRSCGVSVGTVKQGKIDFLRVDSLNKQGEPIICADFVPQRLPWNYADISTRNMRQINEGWSAEAVGGCLSADDGKDWQIRFSTDATDLAIRISTRIGAGSIHAYVNNDLVANVDLATIPTGEPRSIELFRNLPGSKHIVIRDDSAGARSGFSFYGFDVCFDGHADPDCGGNRGNGFPQTYEWALANIGEDALVLDCGSGDRKFADPRVVAFEYMPFELPNIFGDGHALPFADETFDIVFSQAVMEHMRDPYLASREIMRVLKPGGLVYAESAFMQPLHAVPYHFFNTTPWGFESLFVGLGIDHHVTEWFGPLSDSVGWYIDACGGGSLSPQERSSIMELLRKVDLNTNYEQLKAAASAVAFWGVKEGPSQWRHLLLREDRPTFKYQR
jgi:SAM-dependent methyltransferase